MAALISKQTLLVLQFLVTSVLLQQNGGLPEVSQVDRQFRVVYEWRTLDFSYRSDQERSAAIFRGEFQPKNIIISDIKPYANRLYLSVPRMLSGVPATLGWVVAPNNDGRTDPEIEPFPSWEMNQIGNCSALQFVQGIAIDARGFLWAVDSGRVETLLPGKLSLFYKDNKIVLTV